MTHTRRWFSFSRTRGCHVRRGSVRLEWLEDRTVPDVGDTLAAALVTNLGPAPGSYSMYVEGLGDGAFGSRDVDLYRIQAGVNTILTARSSPGPFGDAMDPLLRLFDSAGNQLLANDDYVTTRYGRLDYQFAAAGTYYLGVSGSPNESYNPAMGGSGAAADVMGAYGLQMTLLVAPAIAPDIGDDLFNSSWTNVYGFATANGYSLDNARVGDGALAASDVDMFVLYASAGTSITVRTMAPYPEAAGADTYVRLFDLSGTELAANDDGPAEYGLYSSLTYTFGRDDVYLVGVSGAGNTAYHPWFLGSGTPGDTGLYRLEILLGEFPSVPAPDAGDTVFDPAFIGASGYYQSWQRLGDGAQGAQDVDMYLFYAQAGQTLLSMTSRPPAGASVDTYLRVFDTAGSELAANDDGGAANYSSLSFRFTRSDYYYVGVSSFPNYAYQALVQGTGVPGQTGDYLLDFFLFSANDGFAPRGGDGRDLVAGLLSGSQTPPGRVNQPRMDLVTTSGGAATLLPDEHPARPLSNVKPAATQAKVATPSVLWDRVQLLDLAFADLG